MAVVPFGGFEQDSQCDPGYQLRGWVGIGGLLVHIVLHFICRWLAVVCFGEQVELTELAKTQGVTKNRFPRDAAISIQGALLHAVMSPIALYTAWRMVVTTPANHTVILPSFNNGSFMAPAGEQFDLDLELLCEIWSHGVMLGTIFQSFSLYQMAIWLVGWEKGMDTFVHHAIFLSLSFLCPYVWGYSELTTFALCMELSTPALNMVLIFRSLQGWELMSDSFGALFAIQFLICRPLLFGLGLWRSAHFWRDPPPQAGHIEAQRMTMLAAINIIFALGWILQVVWAVGITRKLLRKLHALIGGSKKKPQKLTD